MTEECKPKSEHTPTPWSNGRSRLIVREVPGMCDCGDYYAIAEAHFHSLLPREEALSNAALIVEAVNNYESLKARVADLEHALRVFRDRIIAHGDWDDGCFYYGATSASELQEPLRLADAALKDQPK